MVVKIIDLIRIVSGTQGASYGRVGVSCGNSRSILNNFSAEVVSYGVGYGGFVAVYMNKKKQPNAVSYHHEHAGVNTGYAVKNFKVLKIDEALKIIKQNPNFIRRKISTPTQEKKLLVEKKKYERKFIGKITLTSKKLTYGKLSNSSSVYTYTITQYKKGTYHIAKSYNNNQWEYRTDIVDFVEVLNEIGNGERVRVMSATDFRSLTKEETEEFNKNYDCVIFENSLPEKVLKQLKKSQEDKKDIEVKEFLDNALPEEHIKNMKRMVLLKKI